MATTRRRCSKTRRKARIVTISYPKWWIDGRSASFHHPRASPARPGDIVKQDVDGRAKPGHDGITNVHRLRNEFLEHDRRVAAGGARTDTARAGRAVCLRNARFAAAETHLG